jgi:DtxR family Mn-dependent transcriptional regulator
MPLLVFLILVLLGIMLFRPRTGFVARGLRLRRMSERVLVEDLLKHLYDCETRGLTATLEGLAGMLETGRWKAHRILERAQELHLVSLGTQGYGLTDTGRTYALRVLRTHRLLERFLADRTGVSPDRWHVEAERQEHLLSPAETESLAHRMGHPLFDPHGDPIPTATGEMPAATGFPLTAARPGTFVIIVHLEDEPLEVYQRLLDAGVSLGQTLEVTDVTPERIAYRLEGEERSLARGLAANLTVELVDDPGAREADVSTLDLLDLGRSALVVGISPLCRGPQRRRLLDLGVVPGTRIRAVMQSASGSPVAYDIRGALIGLRQEQAHWIRVRPDTGAGAAA